MRIVLVAGVAAALLLAACTSSHGSPQQITISSGGGSSSAVGPTSSASSRTTAAPDLTAQLLSSADLPQGWKIDTSVTDDSADAPPCIVEVKTKLHTAVKAERDFIAGPDFPTFQQDIGYFGTSVVAKTVFHAGVAVLNGCTTLTFTASDGTKFTGTIDPLKLQTFGEESAAWRLVLNADGVTVAIDAVLLQKGAELEALFYGNIGAVDAIPLTTFVNKTVAKLPA